MASYFGKGGPRTLILYSKYKKTLRLIRGVNNRMSCRSMFGEFKILTVTSLYVFEILCFIIKNKIYTTQNSDIHSYNTIHKHNLYVQQCNTACCKKSVINRGTKIYNNLPLEIKSVENFKVFKKKLKNYLLHSAFYCLQEFLSNDD
jgi:hypothetical protein